MAEPIENSFDEPGHFYTFWLKMRGFILEPRINPIYPACPVKYEIHFTGVDHF
jgi:hypothetical protein